MKPSNYKRYFSLEKKIKAKGIFIDRKEALSQYTEGRMDSFKDEHFSQEIFNDFCDWIEESYEVKEEKADWQKSPENTMRRKVIALFKEVDYVLEDGKADMKAINEWCEAKSILKKPLNKYTLQELPKLVSQAQKVNKSYIKAVTK